MAHRGGPWRVGGCMTPAALAGQQHGRTSGEQAIAGDRMLRRVVALVGLHEGLW